MRVWRRVHSLRWSANTWKCTMRQSRIFWYHLWQLTSKSGSSLAKAWLWWVPKRNQSPHLSRCLSALPWVSVIELYVLLALMPVQVVLTQCLCWQSSKKQRMGWLSRVSWTWWIWLVVRNYRKLRLPGNNWKRQRRSTSPLLVWECASWLWRVRASSTYHSVIRNWQWSWRSH